MCGRFSLAQSGVTLARLFQLADVPDWTPRFNIAPTQSVPVIAYFPGKLERQFRLLHWGLIPAWAKDPGSGSRLINARSETVAEKPSFRSAFKQRRCLVLADGFYEWQRSSKTPGKTKQPYYFQQANQQPFAFAGLWERWQGKAGEAIDSCTILTTEANALLAPIHDRMPVILEPEDYELWLSPTSAIADLANLLIPYDPGQMRSHAVSTLVNNPSSDRQECINSL